MIKESVPRMLLCLAVFILLSARAIAEETRCYWCGPLAEQVHRSQRAPPCDPFEQHQTVCDKGYTHCAVVATSPPYAISRLCVKFYQDECYSLYCNSTKTWRMVCPCRGDLCNGVNTERENNAFSTLAKLVAKTKRNKRNVISKEKSSFFNTIRTKARDNTTIIFTNNTQLTNAIEGEPQPIEITFKNTTALNNVSKRYNDETVIEHGSTDSLSNEDNSISSITTTFSTTVDVNKDQNEASTPIDVKIIPQSSEMTTTMKTTSVELAINNDNVKVNLPPAEALQHNETPKPTEHTTMGTIEMSTVENIVPIKEMNQTKNSATLNILHIFTPIFTIILHL